MQNFLRQLHFLSSSPRLLLVLSEEEKVGGKEEKSRHNLISTEEPLTHLTLMLMPLYLGRWASVPITGGLIAGTHEA